MAIYRGVPIKLFPKPRPHSRGYLAFVCRLLPYTERERLTSKTSQFAFLEEKLLVQFQHVRKEAKNISSKVMTFLDQARLVA